MPHNELNLEIVQGEDWTADVIWADQNGQGIAVQHPCRMDVKDKLGSTLITLETNPDIPEGEIPSINFSNDIGLLQLHIENTVSAEFPIGRYFFDLFVTTDTDEEYGGSQVVPVIGGTVDVIKRYTEL